MKPYITLLILFFSTILSSQNTNGLTSDLKQQPLTIDQNITGEPKEGKANLEKELGNNWNTGGLDVHFGIADILLGYQIIPEYNPNLFRDQCGNWYLKETFYSTWQTRPLSNSIPEHNYFTIRTDHLNPCWPPMNYKEIEYRLDIEEKKEWFREVKVTYKIVEL